MKRITSQFIVFLVVCICFWDPIFIPLQASAAIAPTVFGYSISKTSGETPLTVTFTIETSSTARGMRVMCDQGNILSGALSSSTGDSGNKKWQLDADITKPYTGTLSIYIKANENDWIPTDAVFDVQYFQGKTTVIDQTTLSPASLTAATVKVGDRLTFGNYQGEGIEWRVLEVDADGRLLVISDKILEEKLYNIENGAYAVTWETSALRAWLNTTFVEAVFTETERVRIAKTFVVNDDNPDYGTTGGKNTQDRIFLLSIAEAKKYFADDDDRLAMLTTYARGQVLWIPDNGADSWWLRSPGNFEHLAAFVYQNGGICVEGEFAFNDVGIRPAFWLNP